MAKCRQIERGGENCLGLAIQALTGSAINTLPVCFVLFLVFLHHPKWLQRKFRSFLMACQKCSFGCFSFWMRPYFLVMFPGEFWQHAPSHQLKIFIKILTTVICLWTERVSHLGFWVLPQMIDLVCHRLLLEKKKKKTPKLNSHRC